eukprot:SAG31_NODE_2258_length_6069_cov_21.781072_11_plen_203_part_01
MAARIVGLAPGLWRRVIGHDRWAAGPAVEGVDKEAERRVMRRSAVEWRRDRTARRQGAWFAAATNRWQLLGRKQLDLGLAKWRQVRGSQWWTQKLDSCVRLVAGRGCGQQAESWAASVTKDPTSAGGDDDVMGAMSSIVSGAIAATQEGEELLAEMLARATAVEGAEAELCLSSTTVLRDRQALERLSRGSAMEARVRAECLV